MLPIVPLFECSIHAKEVYAYRYIGAIGGGPTTTTTCRLVDQDGAIASHAVFECVPPGKHEIRLYVCEHVCSLTLLCTQVRGFLDSFASRRTPNKVSHACGKPNDTLVHQQPC